MVPFLRGVRGKEGSRSDPHQGGRSPPVPSREATPELQAARLNSPVFRAKVSPNVNGCTQNLAGMILGPIWTDGDGAFVKGHQGAKLFLVKGEFFSVLAIFRGF